MSHKITKLKHDFVLFEFVSHLPSDSDILALKKLGLKCNRDSVARITRKKKHVCYWIKDNCLFFFPSGFCKKVCSDWAEILKRELKK